MALFAFGRVAELSLGEDQLHLDLSTAGAEELLSDDTHAGVFAQNFSHVNRPPFVEFPYRGVKTCQI
jgi:hypothetical protein